MRTDLPEAELLIERLPENVMVLRLLGEWDLANASDLQVAAIEALAMTDALVIDLSQAVFLDSTVIHALLRARALAHDERKELILELHTAAVVHRALQVTGVLDQLQVVESDGEAIRLAAKNRSNALAAIGPPELQSQQPLGPVRADEYSSRSSSCPDR